jgi:hypothetical protein
MNLDQLISLFRVQAAKHGECTLNGRYQKGNVHFDKMIAAVKQIRLHGDEGTAALIQLMSDNDDSVAASAATYCLPCVPDEALKVLSAVAAKEGMIAFDARMVIQEWRKGNLKLP